MAKSVDAGDLKSPDRKVVPVRFRFRAPINFGFSVPVLIFSENKKRMKKILSVVLSMVCISAFAQTPDLDPAAQKELLKMGVKLACNTKFPNSEKRCACESDVIAEILPPEVVEKYKTDPAAKEQARQIMRDNQEIISQCSKES